MRSAHSGRHQINTAPLWGQRQPARRKRARLLPKDRYGCQRSGPSRGTGPTKGRPRVTAGQRAGALRHENQSLQPHGPRPPDTAAGSPKGAADRPARKEQPLRCGVPDLAPDGASFRPRWSFPRGDRLAADTEVSASRPRLQDPVTRASSRENRLAADTLCGAPRPAFKARKSWPFRGRDHHWVDARDGASRPAFKTR